MPKIKDEFAEEELPDLDQVAGPLAFATAERDVLEGGDWSTPTDSEEEV